MSVEDNSTTYNTFEMNENVIFVDLLSKYRIILERPTSNTNRRKQDDARVALTNEFNQKCNTSLTMKQILRKLNNIKSRLKEKNYKNSSRFKQLPYLGWEKKFLELWNGNGIAVMTNQSLDIRNQPNKTPLAYQPEEIIMKFEADYNTLDEGPHTVSDSSNHTWEVNQENQPEARLKYVEDSEYESLSLEELKRGVLICQMKTLKAQEAAARANETLKLYKLSRLQENDVIIKKEHE